jgi:hypothetical protein
MNSVKEFFFFSTSLTAFIPWILDGNHSDWSEMESQCFDLLDKDAEHCFT